jgi:Pyruvate/2-oxoacid:ferredoxin oxidoreductase gamma subunit
MIHHLSESTHFFLDSSIPYRETGKKKVVKLPFRKTAKSRKESNLVALGYLLKLMQVIPLKSYVDIIQQWGKNPESSIDSVKAGYEL